MSAAHAFATIPAAIEELRRGRMVVVVDDEARENEGDLVMAAQFATPEAVAFMGRHGRGLLCLALTAARCEQLALDVVAGGRGDAQGTAFTVSVDARDLASTGVSSSDRAHTIQIATDPACGAERLVRPGHVFPLRARNGGVLERPGHTEASVDLARLAGLRPAGVICEILNGDGTMARGVALQAFCRRHGLELVTIASLIAYRRERELLVERAVSTRLPTAFGDFQIVGYRSLADDDHHVAMVKGDVEGAEDVLVHAHSGCLTGDALRSLRCDCRQQLESALATIEEAGRGVLLYLSPEGRGIGLPRPRGSEVDLPGCEVSAQILADLGLSSIRPLGRTLHRTHRG